MHEELPAASFVEERDSDGPAFDYSAQRKLNILCLIKYTSIQQVAFVVDLYDTGAIGMFSIALFCDAVIYTACMFDGINVFFCKVFTDHLVIRSEEHTSELQS